MTNYAIQGGKRGRERLRILSNALRPSTTALLKAVGVPQGAACLDVGCGGGDVSLDLAKLVGPSGKVMGIDFDETKINIAQNEAAQSAIPNVRFHTQDVNELSSSHAYDAVYARFLLTHLGNAKDVLGKMVRAAKPNGLVILEDIDFTGYFCYPKCEAFDQYISLYYQTVRKRGGDPDIGHKLPKMAQDAGLRNMQFAAIQPAFMEDGDGKRVSMITLETIAPAVIADGLATEDELNALLKALSEFTERPDSIVSLPRIFQVWGRK